MSKKKQTVADFIADFLYEEEVRNIFMLSGTGSVFLDDALAKKKGISYICARHECSAVIMAEAVAKLKNNIGVAVVTTGPGGTNAMPGVIESWVDSTPILIISGQVNTREIINDRTFGLQGFNIIENVNKFTKYAITLTDKNKIKYHLKKAIYEAKSGRPGPAWIDIPMDIQSQIINPSDLIDFIPPAKKEFLDFKKLEHLISSLEKAKKPLIVFGRGVKISKTKTKLLDFINKTKIPAISARMANDLIPFDNPFYLGMGGIRGNRASAKVIKEADLIIAMGTSLGYSFLSSVIDKVNKKQNLVVINIDQKIFERNDLEIDLEIQTDLNFFFDEMNQKIKHLNFSNWSDYCLDIKKTNPMVNDHDKKDPINSYYFIERIAALTNSKHIITNDAGSSNYICSQAMQLSNGQREVTSGSFYTMGMTLPLAIGASALEPNSQVIAITGDGSIELNIQELQTISIHNLNIKIFVINNGGYASIRDSQDAMCGSRYTDDSQILDFQKIANAFDIQYEIIKSVKEIDNGIKKVLDNDRPTLIEIICDSKQHMIQPFQENY